MILISALNLVVLDKMLHFDIETDVFVYEKIFGLNRTSR
jgi:hypothetical protein